MLKTLGRPSQSREMARVVRVARWYKASTRAELGAIRPCLMIQCVFPNKRAVSRNRSYSRWTVVRRRSRSRVAVEGRMPLELLVAFKSAELFVQGDGGNTPK